MHDLGAVAKQGDKARGLKDLAAIADSDRGWVLLQCVRRFLAPPRRLVRRSDMSAIGG